MCLKKCNSLIFVYLFWPHRSPMIFHLDIWSLSAPPPPLNLNSHHCWNNKFNCRPSSFQRQRGRGPSASWSNINWLFLITISFSDRDEMESCHADTAALFINIKLHNGWQRFIVLTLVTIYYYFPSESVTLARLFREFVIEYKYSKRWIYNHRKLITKFHSGGGATG